MAQSQKGELEDFLTVATGPTGGGEAQRGTEPLHYDIIIFMSKKGKKGNTVSPHDKSLEAHKHKSSVGKNPCGLWNSSMIL